MLKEEFLILKDNLTLLNNSNQIEIILCPPTTYLYIFENSKYKLGSQEISMYENGAYTGENSAEQLKSLNVSYVLIGHHETRDILKETENSLLNKIVNAFIGESYKDKTNSNTKKVLEKQLDLIKKLPIEIIKNMLIVYEPVWSIGSGKTPTSEELTNNIKLINNFIYKTHNITIPIIYGGSINEKNITYLVNIHNLGGVILGESSTNISTLITIYNKYKKIVESTK